MTHAPPSLWGTVTADRLRLNPFRVLGLGVDASAAQIRRAAEKAAAAGRLGSAPTSGGLLPLPAGPDPAAVREAAHQLRDPAARLLAETFWLHPDPGPEPALWTLGDGQDLDQLCTLWGGLWPDDHPRAGTALHNLAVVELIRALDADAARALEPGRGEHPGPAAATGAGVEPDWSEVLDVWATVLADHDPVPDLRHRAGVLGLTSAACEPAEQWRTAWSRALVDPLVRSVCRELDRGGSPDEEVIDALLDLNLPGDVGEDAVHRIVQHADERIRSVADPGWRRVSADESAALEVANALIETLQGPLDLLRAASDADADEGLAQRACDDVATTLAACATRIAGLHPERRGEALRIARQGADLAIGADAIGQTAWALDSLSGGARQPGAASPGADPRVCTLCGGAASINGAPARIPLLRRQQRDDGRPGPLEHAALEVPACGRCRFWFRLRPNGPLITIEIFAGVFVAVLTVVWYFSRQPLLVGLAAALILGGLLVDLPARAFRRRVFLRLWSHPTIQAAREEGWLVSF